MKNSKLSQRTSAQNRGPAIQALEDRCLRSATTIGIYADQNASETHPTSSGKGVFILKRPTGSTLHSLQLAYTVRSNSTTTTADYQALSGTATIPAGKRSVAINVFPVDDSTVEGTEILALTLKSRSDATNVHSWAYITIADNDSSPSSWAGGTRTNRATFTYNPGSTARTDLPFDYAINFTSVLSGLSKSGSLIDNSIQVVETNSSGTVINNNVPYQFNHASSFNASSNASGDLIVEATGTSAANTTRYYQVYFDTTGSYTAPSFSSLVTTTDNVNDASNINSVKIQTQTATYYYQKAYGAFSSIFDTQGNDWVSWNPTPGSAGEYRGTENLGPVGFHPGRSPTLDDNSSADTMVTTIKASGPLETVIDSKATTTGNEIEWDIFPTFATMKVLSMDRNYWFLYEATPGGSGPDSDDVLYSSTGSQPLNSSNNQPITATSTATDETSDTNFNTAGNEFAYIENTAVNSGNGRYFFLAHNVADNVVDSYYDLDGNMTVLGFGRDNTSGNNTSQSLNLASQTAGQNEFTIGLADGGSNFAAASTNIEGSYKALTLTAGTSSVKPS